MNKVFIFGTGRCGSKTLYEIFRTIPLTHSNHEGVWYDRSGNQKKMGSFREFNKKVFYNRADNNDFYTKSYLNHQDENFFNIMDGFFEKRKKIISACKGKFNYIDINPYSYLFATYIIKKYPDAKFIHLVRNGKEVVRSFYERTGTTYPDGINEENYTGWQSGKPRPLIGNKYYHDWKSYDRFQKICWFWNFVNKEIIKRLEPVSEKNKMLLRLEDLSKNKILDTLEFLKLGKKFDRKKIAVHNVGKKNKIQWDKEKTDFFWDMNYDLMKKIGYKK